MKVSEYMSNLEFKLNQLFPIDKNEKLCFEGTYPRIFYSI